MERCSGMNDYRGLVEQINRGEYIIFKADNPQVYQVTRFNRQIADAIEQLVRERDMAVKNMETATPAVDAVEVVHGHWVDGFDTDGVLIDYDCSACNMANDEKSDYCPNCGARMDGCDEE